MLSALSGARKDGRIFFNRRFPESQVSGEVQHGQNAGKSLHGFNQRLTTYGGKLMLGSQVGSSLHFPRRVKRQGVAVPTGRKRRPPLARVTLRPEAAGAASPAPARPRAPPAAPRALSGLRRAVLGASSAPGGSDQVGCAGSQRRGSRA